MNNNDLFQASRRRFLAQLGGLTVAGEGWSLCGGKTVRTG